MTTLNSPIRMELHDWTGWESDLDVEYLFTQGTRVSLKINLLFTDVSTGICVYASPITQLRTSVMKIVHI